MDERRDSQNLSRKSSKLAEARYLPTAKRPALSRRTHEWTDEEKDRVRQMMQSGSTSVVEIAKYVGNTKSLGQVAEFIEHAQLHLQTFKDTQLEQQPSEAGSTDTDGTEETEDDDDIAKDETPIMDTSILADATDSEPQKAMFDLAFVALLARLVTGNEEATVDKDTYTYMLEELAQFVKTVLVDIFVAKSIQDHTKRNRAKGFIVKLSKTQTEESLKRCGYADMGPRAGLMDKLVSKYVDQESWRTFAANAKHGSDSSDYDSDSDPECGSGSDATGA
ncbi:hypothetical protein FB645_002112 [Coemansia sp. IMI 203386]|nr:hypothetical protein FB645_002112 [Coemansia sp. IMI 203386]